MGPVCRVPTSPTPEPEAGIARLISSLVVSVGPAIRSPIARSDAALLRAIWIAAGTLGLMLEPAGPQGSPQSPSPSNFTQVHARDRHGVGFDGCAV